MRAIKGLIIKDLLQLKSYKRTLIVFMAIFILTSISQENTRNVLTVMITLGFGMFSIATFSYDEMAKSDKYILTFPLTKKEVILSKYILVIGATIIGAIIGVIANIILAFSMQNELPNIEELIVIAIGSVFGIGIVEAIQIPCIYKYGTEKGRIQIFIAIAIIAFLLGGIIWIGEKWGINLLENNMITFISNIIPIILSLATVIIYYISYKVAYRIYQKKEI